MEDNKRSNITGLPSELGIDDELDKQRDHLSVELVTRRYGKPVTLVTGFGPTTLDVDALASELKRTLATGGSVKDGRIELQGSHVDKVVGILNDQGYQATSA